MTTGKDFRPAFHPVSMIGINGGKYVPGYYHNLRAAQSLKDLERSIQTLNRAGQNVLCVTSVVWHVVKLRVNHLDDGEDTSIRRPWSFVSAETRDVLIYAAFDTEVLAGSSILVNYDGRALLYYIPFASTVD